jgi:hypothetical protein
MASSRGPTDAYISSYTPLSAQVFISIPGIDGPVRRPKKPKTPDPSKKEKASSDSSSNGSGGKKSKTKSSSLKLMTVLHNPVSDASSPKSSKRPSSSQSSDSGNSSSSAASPIGSSVINRALLRKHHHPTATASSTTSPPLPIIREGLTVETTTTSPIDEAANGHSGTGASTTGGATSTSPTSVIDIKPEPARRRARDAAMRNGPFIQKNSRRYHTFKPERVPYPRSYDDEVIE